MRRVRKPKIDDLLTLQEIDTVVYRKIPSNDMFKVNGSKDVYEFAKANWDTMDYTESMKIFYMNRSNKIIGTKTVSTGGINGVLVDIRVIFQAALLCSATSMVMIHNHPSGVLLPSDADITITRRVKDAGLIMEIKLLDHIIISDAGYYSMADNGTL